MSHIRFKEDNEEFEVSSSDGEYNKNEKKLLNKFRNRKRDDSESESEVFGVLSEHDSDDQSENDNESDLALSDVEGQEPDDSFPDVRAWGKQKNKYYGADYVDPDYGGFQEKDIQAAEIEEEEAKNLQKQLVEQLDDDDFSLDILFKKKDTESVKDQSEELIKTDLSKLTDKQKLQILQKENPEFFALVDDFKVKMTIAKDYLHPIMQKVKTGEIETCKAVEFVQTHYILTLNYATNIYMYLMLLTNKELKNHPVVKRLYQYRLLLAKMEPVFEEVVKPQIEILLGKNTVENVEKPNVPAKSKKKLLKILTEQPKLLQSKKTTTISSSTQPSKKIKLDSNIEKTRKVTFESKDVEESSESSHDETNSKINQNNKIEMDEENIEGTTEENEGIGKRAITYQIAKNKGLTPHRKKEHRNPRVKHKLKFRKALIRRKGAVREPRKELKRYSGEISGIKTSVSKSIKIK